MRVGSLESHVARVATGRSTTTKPSSHHRCEVPNVVRDEVPNLMHEVPNLTTPRYRTRFGLTLQELLQTTPQRRRHKPSRRLRAVTPTARSFWLKPGENDMRPSSRRPRMPTRSEIGHEDALARRSRGVPAHPPGGAATPREARLGARRQGRQVLGVPGMRSCRLSALVLCWTPASVGGDSEKGVK